jgi:predicted nucleotidyltransferase
MRRDSIIARLKQVEPALRAKGVGALYVFGSAARDEARAGSDLDVFVDPQSDEQFGFLEYMDAYEAIRRAVGEGLEVGYSTRSAEQPSAQCNSIRSRQEFASRIARSSTRCGMERNNWHWQCAETRLPTYRRPLTLGRRDGAPSGATACHRAHAR